MAVGYLLFLIAALAAAQAQAPPPVAIRSDRQQSPDLKIIVQRVEQAARENRERYRAHVITREYRMYSSAEQKPTSTVLAEVSFVPPATKDFKITETKGSSRGETVVRRILADEQKATASGQAPGAVSSENYNFTLLGEQVLDERRCYLLGLQPKRKEKSLIAGRAWVDEDTYLVRRIQGQLAKMPSWWIKSVEVTLEFGNVSGMWLQTHTDARADIRVFGPHTLTESAVKIRTSSTMAEMIPPSRGASRRPLRRPQAVIGSFEH